jgi:hypothetical protein
MLKLQHDCIMAWRLPIHTSENYNFFIMRKIKKNFSYILRYIKKAIFIKDVI